MKTLKKTFTIGNSLAIVIPKEITESLKLQEQELIEIDIQKVVQENKNSFYICGVCNTIFSDDILDPQCSCCGEQQNLTKQEETE